MRRARRLAALALVLATTVGAGAGPASAQRDPTLLWSEYPLEPKPERGLTKAALPGLKPPAIDVADPSEKETYTSIALVVLFVAAAGGMLVAISIIALRLNERRYWY
jgi:hypothetical protein